MSQIKEHIIFKAITLTLVFVLIVPSFVKLAHAFENHKHEVCEVPQKLHFHDFELDCEFYKFKLNTQFYFTDALSVSEYQEQPVQHIFSQYHFLSDYQKLPFSLRGPPCLV